MNISTGFYQLPYPAPHRYLNTLLLDLPIDSENFTPWRWLPHLLEVFYFNIFWNHRHRLKMPEIATATCSLNRVMLLQVNFQAALPRHSLPQLTSWSKTLKRVILFMLAVNTNSYVTHLETNVFFHKTWRKIPNFSLSLRNHLSPAHNQFPAQRASEPWLWLSDTTTIKSK